jgi:hypothetical protein
MAQKDFATENPKPAVVAARTKARFIGLRLLGLPGVP